jgi:hypothetical protein
MIGPIAGTATSTIQELKTLIDGLSDVKKVKAALGELEQAKQELERIQADIQERQMFVDKEIQQAAFASQHATEKMNAVVEAEKLVAKRESDAQIRESLLIKKEDEIKTRLVELAANESKSAKACAEMEQRAQAALADAIEHQVNAAKLKYELDERLAKLKQAIEL